MSVRSIWLTDEHGRFQEGAVATPEGIVSVETLAELDDFISLCAEVEALAAETKRIQAATDSLEDSPEDAELLWG